MLVHTYSRVSCIIYVAEKPLIFKYLLRDVRADFYADPPNKFIPKGQMFIRMEITPYLSHISNTRKLDRFHYLVIFIPGINC